MASIRISGSVGLGGKNVDADIRTVQRSINQLLGSLRGVKELKVDGKLALDRKTPRLSPQLKLFRKTLLGWLVQMEG